jgi:hypothetical protein
MTTIPPVSFVAHAHAHAAHNQYPTTPEVHAPPPMSTPPATVPGNNLAIGPPSIGPAATINISPLAQATAQAMPLAPSTETMSSPSPSASADDAEGAPSPSAEGHEGGAIN